MAELNNQEHLELKFCTRVGALGAILLFLIARIFVAYLTKGHGDPWNIEAFGEYLHDGQSPLGMPYLPTVFPLVFGISWLVDQVGASFSFWLRVWDCCVDGSIIVLLVLLCKQYGKSKFFAWMVAVLYVCNPVSFLMSSLHGQFDQYVFLMILLAVYLENSEAISCDLRAFSVAVSLVLATFAKPIVLIYVAFFFFRRDCASTRWIFLLTYVTGCLLSLMVLSDFLLIKSAVRSILIYGGGGHIGWAVALRSLFPDANAYISPKKTNTAITALS